MYSSKHILGSVAHKPNRKNIFTIAFVFNKYQAKLMVEAGADVICAHLGFTKGGILGAKKILSLEASVKLSNEILLDIY